MTDKVIKTITEHQLITLDSIVGVGFSGGADSVTLLHILANNREKLGIKEIKAIHLHHGIRGEEADRDLEFSKDFCEKLNIEFIPFYENIPEIAKTTGESLEECARRIRYECFKKVNCDVVATAHNLNDNIETFLLNLTRGASLSGLCGIPYKRDKYIRPLLDITRAEIEEYTSQNNLQYVTDSTNLCDDYTRNKLRHNVLPQLFSINPSFDKAFSKCVENLNLSNDFIVNEANKLFEESYCGDYFDCKVFENSHKALKYQVISLILKEKKAQNISREHIFAVNNIISNGGSADVGNGVTVTVERKKLYFGKPTVTEYFEIPFQKDTEKLITPVGEYEITKTEKDLQKLNKQDMDNLIDCDKIFGETCCRNRRDGDYFVPRNRKCTKTLKRLFNDEKISLSKRSEMLILSDEKGIVWTEFFGVSDRCKVTNESKNIINIKKVGD